MLTYLSRRLLFLVPIVLGVSFFGFMLTRLLPGDPALMLAGEQATPDAVARIRSQLQLDRPLPVQYAAYMRGLLRGDLGTAWHTSHTVAEDFKKRYPATVELTLVSMILAVGIGIPVGILSAAFKNRWFDHLARLLSLGGATMPIFWLGLIAIYLFYFRLHWAPAPMGRVSVAFGEPAGPTGLLLVDAIGNWPLWRDALAHIALPALCLSTGTMAIVSRMTRAAMLEVIGQDFIRTARAKGLPEIMVLLKHALRNALIPTVTILGLQFGQLLGGAVLTETIFSWPGLGSYVTESILITDYAPVQAFALVSAAIYVIINLGVDVLYAWIDPRIRYS
ncbi:MAG: ABC transporter permease [Firmicutes bacterium]|nr:ABC transporter permease [Bacillota bacterium]